MIDTAAAQGRDAAVVRITTFDARPGSAPALVRAAAENAAQARRAPGCRSAEVCAAPDDSHTILVVSRWESESAVRDFLRWHETIAQRAVSPHATGRPQSVHYPVLVAPAGRDGEIAAACTSDAVRQSAGAGGQRHDSAPGLSDLAAPPRG